MGLFRDLKHALLNRSSSVKQRKHEEDDAKRVQVSSMSSPRVGSRADGTSFSKAKSGMVVRTQSLTVPRIDSVTTYDSPGSRFQTTVVERQGSMLILHGVKQMRADSDVDEDEDAQDAHPNPDMHSPAAASPGAQQQPEAPPGPRRLNRMASLPMMLDGRRGLLAADPAQPSDGSQAASPSGYSGQSPAGHHRQPGRRRDSLKALLSLDQYGFNEDVDIKEAQEALRNSGDNGDRPPSTGTLEDIIGTDGRVTAVVAVSEALPLKMRRRQWRLDDYVLLKQMHKGYASDVYQARCKLSGDLVALKVYKLAEQGDIQRMQLYREIKLHSTLRHTNIVQFYACFLERNRVVLVQEFAAGGDLLRFMYKCGGRLFERQAVGLVLQPFLTALHYLHSNGIVHRDIKPENILFTENKTLKVADFGLAISLVEERPNTRAGTLDYMAPEVLRCPTKKTPDEFKEDPEAVYYTQDADVWAVGVFAYELIVGVPPFKAGQMIDTARNIIHASVVFPDSVSELARDFISAALRKSATERPRVIELLHHSWITMFQRRSSVRIMYTRSNSLMEMMAKDGAAAAGGGDGQEARRQQAAAEAMCAQQRQAAAALRRAV